MEKYTLLLGIALVLLSVLIQMYRPFEHFQDLPPFVPRNNNPPPVGPSTPEQQLAQQKALNDAELARQAAAAAAADTSSSDVSGVDVSGVDVSGSDVSGNHFATYFAELITLIAPRLKIAPEGEEPIDITIQKVWSTDLNDIQSYLESKYNKKLADRATTPLSTTTTDSPLSPVLAQGQERK